MVNPRQNVRYADKSCVYHAAPLGIQVSASLCSEIISQYSQIKGLSCDQYQVIDMLRHVNSIQVKIFQALPIDERSPEDRLVLELAKVFKPLPFSTCNTARYLSRLNGGGVAPIVRYVDIYLAS